MIVEHGYFLVDLAELHVVTGDVDNLWQDLTIGKALNPTLFVRADQSDKRHYIFSAAERGLIVNWTRDQLEAELKGLLAAVQTDRHTQPGRRTVIIDSTGQPTGAWIPISREGGGSGGSSGSRRLTGQSQPRRYRGRPSPPDVSPPPNAAPTEWTGDAAFRRTPHLDSPTTIPTGAGTEFTISVYVDDQPFDEDEAGSDILVDAPPEVTKIRVRVVLLTSDHFVIASRNFFDFDIERDRPRSRPVTFILVVADQPPADAIAAVTATFSHQGRPSGHVTKLWTWDPSQTFARTTAPAGTEQKTPNSRSLVMYTAAEPVDLAVEILGHGNGLDFDCVVQARCGRGKDIVTTAPYGLSQRAPEMVGTKLAAMRSKTATPAERSDALRRAGYDFWNAAPANVKSTFWQLVDAGRTLRSISIVSEEPCLPWELMIPFRPPRTGQTVDELPPLGVTYAIGRWCRRREADGTMPSLPAPPPTIPLTTSFVIAPRYRKFTALDARAEVRIIRTLMNGRRIREASQQSFDTYFRRHAASALHFVCHGDAGIDHDDVLYLDDDQALPSASLYTTDGLKDMCRRQAPFVFINACSTGAQVPGLTGGAGFPLAFGNIGARAIVAPLWPVKSTIASDVAVDLYQRALTPGGPPVAEVLRTIRARAYQEGGADSYAAYAFYGDPQAKFVLV